MPAWIYSLGSVLMENAGFRLPLSGLALNMTVLIVPALVGHILAAFLPSLKFFANIANKLIHSVIFIALFLTLILTSRFYTFKLGNPMFMLIGNEKKRGLYDFNDVLTVLFNNVFRSDDRFSRLYPRSKFGLAIRSAMRQNQISVASHRFPEHRVCFSHRQLEFPITGRRLHSSLPRSSVFADEFAD